MAPAPKRSFARTAQPSSASRMMPIAAIASAVARSEKRRSTEAPIIVASVTPPMISDLTPMSARYHAYTRKKMAATPTSETPTMSSSTGTVRRRRRSGAGPKRMPRPPAGADSGRRSRARRPPRRPTSTVAVRLQPLEPPRLPLRGVRQRGRLLGRRLDRRHRNRRRNDRLHDRCRDDHRLGRRPDARAGSSRRAAAAPPRAGRCCVRAREAARPVGRRVRGRSSGTSS